MSYIAFLDMVGTQYSAMLSNENYINAIQNFNRTLKQMTSICDCKIFAYSDNAYIEMQTISDLLDFFKYFRESLMNNHHYFAAAVEKGTLGKDNISQIKNKFSSMIFTSPDAIRVYKRQCQFTGIGISLSERVVEDINKTSEKNKICESIFQKNYNIGEACSYTSMFDISYDSVDLANLEYIFSDYLTTTAVNSRAGRYYITPIISMIKSINADIIKDTIKFKRLLHLLSFNNVPDIFRCIGNNEEYSILFIFAIIDSLFTLRDRDDSVDVLYGIKEITKLSPDLSKKLIEILPNVSHSVISDGNKKRFLSILYGINKESEQVEK